MSRPWFPFYVGDYTRDTARLTTEAHGAYLLLMLDYWVNGAPPDDDETLATITKLPISIWKKRRPILVKFFKIKEGQWVHARIEKERAKAEEVGTSNSDKAREAAERRWAKERERKLSADAEQCLADAPSTNRALLQNAQSQSQPPSNPDSEKGESNSRSVLKLVEEGKGDGPIPIDETYQPSDRAIEYAYSLGMKKAELEDELRKFIAKSISVRVVSFNIDMNFKLWCDRWLEFKRRHNPDWKPAAVEAPSAPVEDRSSWPIVVDGTLEHTCWNAYNREKGLRPLFMCKQLRSDGTIIDRGAKCETLFPPGFNDFGERVDPGSEDAA